jgi:hypothetical protein
MLLAQDIHPRKKRDIHRCVPLCPRDCHCSPASCRRRHPGRRRQGPSGRSPNGRRAWGEGRPAHSRPRESQWSASSFPLNFLSEVTQVADRCSFRRTAPEAVPACPLCTCKPYHGRTVAPPHVHVHVRVHVPWYHGAHLQSRDARQRALSLLYTVPRHSPRRSDDANAALSELQLANPVSLCRVSGGTWGDTWYRVEV